MILATIQLTTSRELIAELIVDKVELRIECDIPTNLGQYELLDKNDEVIKTIELSEELVYLDYNNEWKKIRSIRKKNSSQLNVISLSSHALANVTTTLIEDKIAIYRVNGDVFTNEEEPDECSSFIKPRTVVGTRADVKLYIESLVAQLLEGKPEIQEKMQWTQGADSCYCSPQGKYPIYNFYTEIVHLQFGGHCLSINDMIVPNSSK